MTIVVDSYGNVTPMTDGSTSAIMEFTENWRRSQ